MFRKFAAAAVALAFLVSPAQAQKDAKKDKDRPAAKDKKKPGAKGRAKTHTGVVVKVEGNKLTMKTRGKEHTHEVPATARIIVRGKKAKLSDLKTGVRIRVTTRADGKTVVSVRTLPPRGPAKDRKPADRKPGDKKPGKGKKPAEKKPVDPKPAEKKPADAPKPPPEKKPADE